jgi:hypothetical protein
MPEKQSYPRKGPFPLGGETYAGFERAFGDAAEHSQISMDKLRAAVRSCVEELKGAGLGPESVLVTIKACVRHFDEEHFRVNGLASRSARQKLAEQITTWCIEDYYSRK